MLYQNGHNASNEGMPVLKNRRCSNCLKCVFLSFRSLFVISIEERNLQSNKRRDLLWSLYAFGGQKKRGAAYSVNFILEEHFLAA